MHEMPDERGVCGEEHIDQQLCVQGGLHGGRREWGELCGVRVRNVQVCSGLRSVHELSERCRVR